MCMGTSKVTSKGQITIPIDVRRALKLKAGSRVEFVALASGAYEIAPVTASIKDLKGIVPKPKAPVSLKQMDDAIAAGASGRTKR